MIIKVIVADFTTHTVCMRYAPLGLGRNTGTLCEMCTLNIVKISKNHTKSIQKALEIN
jgi:hypothetical protein